MSKIRLLLAAALILALSTAVAVRAAKPSGGEAAQANLDILVNTLRANRKAMVAVNLKLTNNEAASFWPVYDRYQKELNEVGNRVVRVIQDYSANFHDLSNDKAMKLVEDYLSAEEDRVKVRRSYLPEFAKILPGRKVARFYQIENKMDAVIRFDLASKIPVIEDQGGAQPK